MLGTDHCGLRLPLCTLSCCPVLRLLKSSGCSDLSALSCALHRSVLNPVRARGQFLSATLSKNGNRTVAVDDNIKRIGVSVMGRSAHAGVESTHFGAAHVSSQATASAL